MQYVPVVRKIVGAGVRGTVRLVKTRRANRIATGKRVFGDRITGRPRVKSARNSGRSGGGRGGSNRAPGITGPIATAPVAITTVSQGVSKSSSAVRSVEVIGPVTTNVDGSSFHCYSWPINPSYSEYWPKLAAEAALYQKFTCGGLKFAFTPTVSTNTGNGNVVLAFVPNPNYTTPASLDELMSIDGMQATTTWNKLEVSVPQALLNKSFNQQMTGGIPTASPSEPTTVQEPLNCVGRLFVGTSGVPNSTAIGLLTASYSFSFTDRKFGYEGTGLKAETADLSSTATNILFNSDTLSEGRQPFDTSDVVGVYFKRHKAPALLWIKATGAANPLFTLTYGATSALGTTLTPLVDLTDAAHVHFRLFKLPQGNLYLKLANTAAVTTNHQWGYRSSF